MFSLRSFVIFLITLQFLAPQLSVKAEDTPTPKADFGNGLFICKDGKLAPGEDFTEKLKACNEPTLYVEKDLKCISVCTTEAIGGLKDGIPDKNLFVNIIKTEFPEAEQENALERLDKCFENKTFDKSDKTCSGIAEFSACGTKLVTETKC